MGRRRRLRRDERRQGKSSGDGEALGGEACKGNGREEEDPTRNPEDAEPHEVWKASRRAKHARRERKTRASVPPHLYQNARSIQPGSCRTERKAEDERTPCSETQHLRTLRALGQRGERTHKIRGTSEACRVFEQGCYERGYHMTSLGMRSLVDREVV